MNKLTCLEGLPRPDPARVAPHNYRRLAGRVLITNDAGYWAALSEDDYRRYLGGIEKGDPLWAELQPKGFLRHSFDFDAAAAEAVETGFPAWKGPSTHLLLLEHGGRAMPLETARRAVDFAFSAPGPQLTLELAAGDAEAVWPVAWFVVQYSRRRSEWTKRPLFLALRARGGLPPERVEFLRGHAVTRRVVLDLRGGPRPGALPAFRAQRALCVVDASSREPQAWADWLADAGIESARLAPGAGILDDEDGLRRFLGFYSAFLRRVVENYESKPLREEWAASFLSRLVWNLPGTDVLEEIAYGPSGDIFTSETGLVLEGEGTPLFRLGSVDSTRYEELAAKDAVRACVAAVLADNQPLCTQCVYKPFCTLPPAENFRLQGTVWGQTPSSPLCTVHMGVLDKIFETLFVEDFRAVVEAWLA